MMVNYYSGPDRGNEALTDGVNLKLPSGKLLDWGNIDFDVNLIVSDAATDQTGQLFFDIFDTDGFLGDLPLVNFAYAPNFDVVPRPYRFRILNACMSRFVKLAISWNGSAVPFKFIANDGNLVVNPDSTDAAGRAGHRRALRHRHRLLPVQGRRKALPREPAEADRWTQARQGSEHLRRLSRVIRTIR